MGSDASSKATRQAAAPDQSGQRWARFRAVIEGGTDRLIDLISIYARRHDYTKYTSTLREAWRVSVVGLSESLLLGLDRHGDVPELHPDEDYSEDPIAAFGVLEAQRHRERGVRLDMFLGMLKYYRQSYHELVDDGELDGEELTLGHRFVERFFDRVELGFLTEWAGHSDAELLAELQTTNRRITNEKNKYLTIFESISDPVILLDAEGRLENLNHAAIAVLLGEKDPGAYYYGTRDVVGLFPWLPAVLEAYDARRGEQDFEYDIRTTKGLRRFAGKLAPMLDISEKYSGSVVILTDVTERVKAREELEMRVAERTAELKRTHEQLLHSQKLDAIGTLAGGVAHDLNNLLQVIGGYGELLEMDMSDADEARRSLVDQMVHASDRATSLVRQLLLFSRRQPMERRALDVNRTVENLSKMLRRVIGENVTIDLQLVPELPGIVGDEGSIEQVLMNLVVNARDAMPEGGVVTIRTEAAEFEPEGAQFPGIQPGSFVRVVVEDQGGGMHPETQQHIFEPFFTTKGAGEGTGLGLSVVYGIVKEHDGWIDVYSEVGIGTTFKVYLPASREAGDDACDERPTIGQLRGAGERVLLVEDQDAVRAFISAVLTENGYEVHAAAAAEAALRVHAELGGRVDCVITDVVLPGMTGVQLAEVLLEAAPDQKILFISGYTANAAQWSRMRDRGYRLLPKPFSLLDLLRHVRDVLTG